MKIKRLFDSRVDKKKVNHKTSKITLGYSLTKKGTHFESISEEVFLIGENMTVLWPWNLGHHIIICAKFSFNFVF